MSWLDGLRMRVIHGAGEPDRSPKRYAPYSVWSIARVIGAVGFAALPLAIVLGGGYASHPSVTADLHAVAHREAARVGSTRPEA